MRVGFIGVTTPSTPKFLLDRYAERFRFTDISDAVNRWVRVLRSAGRARDRRARARRRADAGRVRRTRLRRRDRRGGARDEPRGGRGGRGAQPLPARHPRAERGRLGRQADRGGALVRHRVRPGRPHDRQADRRRGGEERRGSRRRRTTWRGDARMASSSRATAGGSRRWPTRCSGETDTGLTRAGGELGRLAADAEREFAGTDAAVVDRGALRADIDARADHLRRRRRGARVRPPGGAREADGAGSRVRRRRGSTPGRAARPGQDLHRRGERDAAAAREPVGTEIEAMASYLGRLRSPHSLLQPAQQGFLLEIRG